MIPLDDKRWGDLQHAYGSAADIPDLLRKVRTAPRPAHYREEPWFSIWSALCHQGDVYTATYAAVPFMAQYATERPMNEQFEFLHFIGWAEACRNEGGQPQVPEDLSSDYAEAIRRSKQLFLSALRDDSWDEADVCTLLGGLAVLRGFHQLGRLIMSLDRCTVCGEYSAVEPSCDHMSEAHS